MADELVPSFAVLLRRLRAASGMTQEELALAAGLHPRTVSDLERGVALKAQRATVRLLANALRLDGAARSEFEAAARGHYRAARSWAAPSLGTESGSDPQAWLRRLVSALEELGPEAARQVVAQWRSAAAADPAWLAWADQLISLTAAGRLDEPGHRPLPPPGSGVFLGRERQAGQLTAFLEDVRRGRGGLALVLGPEGIGKSRLLAEVLADWSGPVHPEWVTLDRGEAGYRGWRRLLAPLWIRLRRSELAPAGLLGHAATLDRALLETADTGDLETLFLGQVAVSFAALLQHAAKQLPIALVLDDAHRGGSTSDRLLVEVARRVTARPVAIIAGLRPDELEEHSPLRKYAALDETRAAFELVVPIHLPPLDLEAVAGLLQERVGAAPPPEIVEQVLQQTGGCPQLIRYSPVRRPDSGTASRRWVVGRLHAEGLRGLEATIMDRADETRDVLTAAAVCATGRHIDVPLLGRVAGLTADEVGRVLSEERRRGSILMADAPGYFFQHDSWLAALTGSCPPDRLRALHARCLATLQADPASDPQLLAQHAMAAGSRHVDRAALATLASKAAAAALADHAFSAAAAFYAAAAQHAAGPDRIDLLISQADALRFGDSWDEARAILKHAASAAKALGSAGREAVALIHLERLTWSYGLDEQGLIQQMRDVLCRLPPEEVVLRAQAQAGLALRLAISTRQHQNEPAELAQAAFKELPSVPASLARADILIGVRGALQDCASPDQLIEFDEQLLDLGMRFHSAYHIEEALTCRVADLVRGGRLTEVPAAVRAHRDFAEQSAAPLAIYSHALIDGMLALAHGHFRAANAHTCEAARLSADWGESMAGEAIMAQSGWLLYETGQLEGLAGILAALPDQNVSVLNEPVWLLGAGLIHAEQGDADAAGRILREVCATTGDFAGLPRGPSRMAILATAATLLGHPALAGQLSEDDVARWADSIADSLQGHPDAMAVAGWPAVILGSKDRFIGLAHLAAGRPALAATHLARAVDQNAGFAVLKARALFDLARALMMQSPGTAEGGAAMRQAWQLATDLGMANLVRQAAAKLAP